MADWTLIIFSSFTKMSSYQNVLIITKMSSYQNVLLPNCPVTEMSVTEVSFTKMSWIRGTFYSFCTIY